ncbi:reverse transcriptase domain-containing protein [Tanacetum coccineum]
MDFILDDSVDEGNLADPNNDLVDTIPEMFTDEHTLDYSSPPLYDDVYDDLVELESNNDDVYDDPFDSKEDKIRESKLLIDELDPPRSSDFLPSLEKFPGPEILLSSFSYQTEEKVFNPGIPPPSKGVHKLLFSVLPPGAKIHKVHVVAYTEDGLSLIGTQIGKPIMLDTFTSSMCGDTWGRMGYARALIEVSAEKKLKQEVVMGVPLEDGTGHKIERIKVEYEWKPPVCTDCHIFGYSNSQCPKRDPVEVVVDVNEPTHDGFTVVTKRRKRSKAKENNNAKQFEGLRLGKSKTIVVWTKKTNTTDGTNKVDDSNLKDLKNQFFALQDQDNVGESSNENGNVKDLDADD